MIPNFIGELKRQSVLAGFAKSNMPEDKCDYDDVLMKADDDKQKVKIHKVMKEYKEGKLKSSSGDAVTDRKQAIAIAMSEAGISKIKKSEEGEIEMTKKEFKTEHKRLINTLQSKSKKDDKQEIAKQKKEAKEYNVDLKKSNGEGSKGGKIIGHTKSGKPIYESHDNAAHKNFTSEDHYDASEMHDNMYEKLEKKHPEENRTKEQQAQMSHHATQAQEHHKKWKAGEKQLKKAIENIFK